MKGFIVVTLILMTNSLLFSCQGSQSKINLVQNSSTNSNYKLPIQFNPANHMIYETNEELEKDSDLIIVGKIKTDFEQSQPIVVEQKKAGTEKLRESQSVVVKDKIGIVDYYTITPVDVKKVVKGSFSEKQVKVIEAGAVVEEAGKTKYIMARENFSPLQKNSKYLLFLKKIDPSTYPNLADVYSIISINQGKFNADGTDKKELDVEGKNDRYKKLKESTLEKFKKETDAVP